MASNYWAKIWIETLDDPKVARLPDSSWRRFFECVLLAKELDEGGILPTVPDMSWRLRLSDTTMSDDLHRLALAGLVELREYDGEERWFISNFQKRQDGMTNAERQKRYRDSHTSGGRNGVRITTSVTGGYTNPVTVRNAETETEKDTDTEGEGEAASAARTPTRAHYGQFDRTPGTNGKGYKLPSEPPVSPPAAQLMQRLTGRYPGANNIGYIAQRLGDNPDEAALADVVREWSARGYSMSNYAGMCDWYDERKDNPQWKPSRNGTGKATAQPAAILTQPIVNGLY